MNLNRIRKLSSGVHLKRLVLSLCLAACVAASPFLPFVSDSGIAFAERSTDITTSDITDDPFEASVIDYMRTVYPEGTLFPPGTGALCYQFAQKFTGLMASETKMTDYKGVKITKQNILEKLGNCPPGTTVRLGRTDNDFGSHSIVILKITKDRVWWSECNRNGYNKCHYYTNTLDGFVHYSQCISKGVPYFNYISYKIEPVKDEAYIKPEFFKAKAAKDGGKVYLAWITSTNTKEYNIYRADASGSDYELIGTSKTYRYTDKTAKAGTTYKYKITAVKESGKTVTSDVLFVKAK